MERLGHKIDTQQPRTRGQAVVVYYKYVRWGGELFAWQRRCVRDVQTTQHMNHIRTSYNRNEVSRRVVSSSSRSLVSLTPDPCNFKRCKSSTVSST